MRNVSKIEYPFYSTNDKKLNLSNDCLINPFDEFVEFSIRTYYPNLTYMDLSMEDYFNFTEEKRIETLKNILSDYSINVNIEQGKREKANIINGVISSNDLDIYKDGELCCSVSIQDVDAYYISDKIPSSRFMIKITFHKNESLSYIIQDMNLNEFVFHEITEGKYAKNQINVVCSIVAGILNITDYIKFHKINAIKTSTISSYLRAYPDLNDKLYIVYNYDSAYLTYSSDSKFKMYIVRYDNYINDIDKIIETYNN